MYYSFIKSLIQFCDIKDCIYKEHLKLFYKYNLMYRLIRLFPLFFIGFALVQNNPPGGNIKKFISSVPAHKDLYKISSSKASLISKNWLQNIVVTIFQKQRKKIDERMTQKSKDFDMSKALFELEDAHIVTSINQLEDYIQNHRQETDVYMCWKPKSIRGIEEILFIVVAEIDIENQIFSIKQLVQSPFWSPEQISSSKLKEALINMNQVNNCTKIDMNYLYRHDLRYRLAWATWSLELDNDTNLKKNTKESE